MEYSATVTVMVKKITKLKISKIEWLIWAWDIIGLNNVILRLLSVTPYTNSTEMGQTVNWTKKHDLNAVNCHGTVKNRVQLHDR